MRKTFLAVILGFSLVSVFGQNKIDKIKISQRFQFGPLTWMYDELSKKYGIPIVYDTAVVRTIQNEFWFDNKPFLGAIKSSLEDTQLKYYLNEDSTVIFIVTKEKYLTREIQSFKRYTGNPEKFNFQISGKLLDKNTGEPLPFAYVSVKNTKNATSSNVDGYFTLIKVPSDTSTLVLQYIGYKKQEFFLTPKSKLKDIVIEMEPDAQNLEEVVVMGEKQSVMATSENSSLIKLTPQKLTTLPSMGEKDIMRSFQLMPGIGGSNESSSGLYVKGGSPDQNLVLYDGFTVYHVDHLFGFYSAFNSNAIKDVQLYKGGFEAKFGGRTSSVTEITGKEGNKKKFSVGGDVSLLSANVYAEAPIGEKITFLVAGRRSYQGILYDKIFNRYNSSKSSSSSNMPKMPAGMGATETTPSSYFYDINSKITYKPTSKDVISWSVYNGTDNLDNSRSIEMPSFGGSSSSSLGNNNISDLTNWGNTGTSMKWSRKWSDNFYSNSLISYSNYFYEKDRSSTMNTTTSDGASKSLKRGDLQNNDLKDFSFKTDNEWKLNQNNQLEFGINLTYNNTEFKKGEVDTSLTTVNSNKGNTYALYIQDKINLWDNKIQIIPGLRFNRFTGTGKNYIEPRLSGSWKATDKLTLRASWGIYNQFVKRIIHEDIMSGSTNFWALADNTKLPVSRAIHYLGGISYNLENYIVEVEAYYKSLSGLSEYTLSQKPGIMSTSSVEKFYTGTGSARGLDFMVQKKYGNYTGWVGYSLGQVVNYFPEDNSKPFYASYDVTHEFKAVNQLKLGKNWDLSATWVYATGKPYTSVQGVYQVQLLDGSTKDYYTASARNGNRYPAYHRLDLAATFSWRGESEIDKSLSFSLFNVYNRQNIWYKEYTTTDEKQILTTDVKYLGITPNLTFSIKF